MMRICNHCGKFYDADKGKCHCKYWQDRRKQRQEDYYKFRKEHSNNFYGKAAWRKMVSNIKARDFSSDRLQMYLSKIYQEKILNAAETKSGTLLAYLCHMLLSPDGKLVRLSDRKITVHHIIPLEDDFERRFDEHNLITLSYATHDLVHDIYKGRMHEFTKQEMQRILQAAVESPLP